MGSASPLAVESVAISDVDAMTAAMADGVVSEYVQLDAKPFTGHWAIARFSKLTVQFGRADIAVVRRIRVPAEKWAFMVPLAVPESRWNGRGVDGDELIVCPPRAECYAFDAGGTRFAILSVPERGSLARCARHLIGRDEGPCTLRPRAHNARELRDQLCAMATAAEVDRPISKSAGPVIAGTLVASLEGAVVERRTVALPGRSQIVHRAEEFFRCHVGEPVSMARLSSVAGVSERSLRNAFYDVCTTSPKRYLKLWQLHQVRRALRAAERGVATVTNVATFHGFFELGRFAGEYKALFGESPSETLSQARIRNSPRPGF